MLFALMVMPRSRSRSIESRTCSCISRSESAPVISSRRSASVDLPWSMCAMMQKFRMNFGSMYLDYRLVPFQLVALISINQETPAVGTVPALRLLFNFFSYRREAASFEDDPPHASLPAAAYLRKAGEPDASRTGKTVLSNVQFATIRGPAQS